MGERTELTAEQIPYARALLLVERLLAPKCENCGYGADRQKCPMDLGGHCEAHEQKSYRNWDRVRGELRRLGQLDTVPGWKYETPLHLLHEFSPTERDLLLDLHDKGGKQTSRRHDERYDPLGCGSGGKGAVMQSFQTTNKVELTERGRELVERWICP